MEHGAWSLVHGAWGLVAECFSKLEMILSRMMFSKNVSKPQDAGHSASYRDSVIYHETRGQGEGGTRRIDSASFGDFTACQETEVSDPQSFICLSETSDFRLLTSDL